MATDPSDIRLSNRLKEKLAELEERTGTQWDHLLDTLINSADAALAGEKQVWVELQEHAFSRVWDNEHDAVFDEL